MAAAFVPGSPLSMPKIVHCFLCDRQPINCRCYQAIVPSDIFIGNLEDYLPGVPLELPVQSAAESIRALEAMAYIPYGPTLAPILPSAHTYLVANRNTLRSSASFSDLSSTDSSHGTTPTKSDSNDEWVALANSINQQWDGFAAPHGPALNAIMDSVAEDQQFAAPHAVPVATPKPNYAPAAADAELVCKANLDWIQEIINSAQIHLPWNSPPVVLRDDESGPTITTAMWSGLTAPTPAPAAFVDPREVSPGIECDKSDYSGNFDDDAFYPYTPNALPSTRRSQTLWSTDSELTPLPTSSPSPLPSLPSAAPSPSSESSSPLSNLASEPELGANENVRLADLYRSTALGLRPRRNRTSYHCRLEVFGVFDNEEAARRSSRSSSEGSGYAPDSEGEYCGYFKAGR
ncbi:hypothetical protein ACQY0O_008359 [Thecaphora frezii]